MASIWEYVRLLVVLGIVLAAIIYFIKFGLVRLHPRLYRQKGALKIVERLFLGQKCGLILIQAGQRYFLLGVSAERINMLTELKSEDVPDLSAAAPPAGFGQYLNNYLRRGERNEKE